VKYLLDVLKLDDAFNYKKGNLDEHLKKTCPKGIDIYWDSVGGKTLEHVLNNCNDFARIVACGYISQYNNAPGEGVNNLSLIVGKRIRIQGFVFF